MLTLDQKYFRRVAILADIGPPIRLVGLDHPWNASDTRGQYSDPGDQ